MKACVLIPARMQSSRFPGKVLCEIAGKPMVRHVYEAACAAECRPDVFVATGDEVIADVVRDFGGQVIRTYGEHQSGTDRIAEAVSHLDHEVIVNVQADEPMLRPEKIDHLVEALQDADVSMASVYRPLLSEDELQDPNRVKVVLNDRGDAVQFSRTAVAALSGGETMGIHLGIYGYLRSRLLAFTELPQSHNEKIYALEQLRAMDAGWPIRMVASDWHGVSVDTPVDLERVRSFFPGSVGEMRC